MSRRFTSTTIRTCDGRHSSAQPKDRTPYRTKTVRTGFMPSGYSSFNGPAIYISADRATLFSTHIRI